MLYAPHLVKIRVDALATVQALTTNEERRSRLSYKLGFAASRGNELSFFKIFEHIGSAVYWVHGSLSHSTIMNDCDLPGQNLSVLSWRAALVKNYVINLLAHTTPISDNCY